MRARRENLFHLIEPLLAHVEHPARYLDHEWGACEEQDGPFHLCMVYADVYEVGQPNLGVAILYNQVNAQEGMSCERCYLPWKDLSELMREKGVPLLSLEGAAPLAAAVAPRRNLALVNSRAPPFDAQAEKNPPP